MGQIRRAAGKSRMPVAYDVDLAAWAIEQAANLRTGAWSQLDLVNLIDEVEALARAERNAFTSALRVILLDILKWDHQPTRRNRSWCTSIRIERMAGLERLEDSPSLSGYLPEAMDRAYRKARVEAAGETGLDEDLFPENRPYGFEEIMGREFPWPPAEI